MNSVSLNNSATTISTQIESNQNEALKRKLEGAKDSKDDKELRDAAEQFESVFINMMLKTMRSTIPEGQSYIEKSNASETFESMLDEEMSNSMSKGGGFGLSDMIYKSLVRRAEIEDSLKNDQIKGSDPIDVGLKDKTVKAEETSEIEDTNLID